MYFARSLPNEGEQLAMRFVSGLTILFFLFLSAGTSSVVSAETSPLAIGTQLLQSPSVYLSPHPDDWQLLMGSSVSEDVKANRTIIIIQVTAGDAGQDHGYWRAREISETESVCVLTHAPIIWGFVTVHNFTMLAVVSGSITVVFMHLPDGGAVLSSGDVDEAACEGFGHGSPRYGCRSLSDLRDHNQTIFAIDSSAYYHSWIRLVDAIVTIVEHYAGGASRVRLNAPEYDRNLNPGDHPDHYAVGDLAEQIQARGYRWSYRFYKGYVIETLPRNLDPQQRDVKYRLSMAYADLFKAFTGIVTWKPGEIEPFLWREYYRSDGNDD